MFSEGTEQPSGETPLLQLDLPAFLCKRTWATKQGAEAIFHGLSANVIAFPDV